MRSTGDAMKLVLFALVALFAPLPSRGPFATTATGTIVGTVADSTGTPLVHASVFIVGLCRCADVRGGGTFTMGNVPAGTHHLRALAIGHVPGEADSVVVVEGSIVYVDFVLAALPPPDEHALMIDMTPVRDSRLMSGSNSTDHVPYGTPWRVGAPPFAMTVSREEQALQWIQSRPRVRR
jgi:hypothetical protein